MGVELFSLLDELRAMDQTGLAYTQGQYVRERYNRLLELVGKYYGRTLDLPPETVGNGSLQISATSLRKSGVVREFSMLSDGCS